MPSGGFATVPDRLLEHAEDAYSHFCGLGYSVRVEPTSILYPYTPTLVCKRQRTTIIVEVGRRIRVGRADSWAAFARSSGQDTRIAVFLPSLEAVSADDEQRLRTLGVGLYVDSPAGVVERLVPNDLGLNVGLPPLRAYPAAVRKALGPAYEQFSRSQWREGFEDACQALEVAARRHLKAGCRLGRIKLATKRGTRVPSSASIDRMSMGALARTFASIQSPNYVDKTAATALAKLNTDRVGVAHHKTKPSTEKRLRTNVGRNMWLIVAAIKELLS